PSLPTRRSSDLEVGFLANDRLLDQRRVQGTGRSGEQAGHDLAGDLRNLLVWSGLRPSAASGASGARDKALLVLLARRRLLLARRLQVDELVTRRHEERG